MKIVQAIAVIVAILAGVFLLGGQLLPSKLVFVRHGELCHGPTPVREALETPSMIAAWSLFTREAELPVSHGGGPGPGGWVRWTGDDGDRIELQIDQPGDAGDVAYVLDLNGRMTIPAGARLEPVDGDGTSLRLSMTVEPETIGGRWSMMAMHWMPGEESLGDVLAQEIDGLREYLAETRGECPSGP